MYKPPEQEIEYCARVRNLVPFSSHYHSLLLQNNYYYYFEHIVLAVFEKVFWSNTVYFCAMFSFDQHCICEIHSSCGAEVS